MSPFSHTTHFAQNRLSEACTNMGPGQCQDWKALQAPALLPE